MTLLRALCAFLIIATGAAAQSDGPAVYSLDSLNDGLPEPPDWVDRSTPRATMETLLFAAALERFDDAAHLLNLNGYPPGEQSELGARLARQLEVVIDRKAVIDWGDLLDRPDAMDATASSNSAVAGMARKSILLWSLDLNGRPAAIRMNRYQAGESEPVWLFSEQTVENITSLHSLYGPSWLELKFPAWARRDTTLGLMVWELIGLPLLIAAAALLGFLVKRVLDAAARRVDTPVVNDILKAIRGPAIFGTVVALVSWASTSIFVFSGRIDTILQPLIVLGIWGSVLWLIVNAIDAVLDRLVTFNTDELSKAQMAEAKSTATKVAAARRALIVVFSVMAVGIALSSTNIYSNLGLSIVGTAGALTLVLGFAARRVLGNIMSSLQIALNQSARIGDRVVYKDYLCHVERINFTYVQLRDWRGLRIVVPVEEFTSSNFENWTLQEPEMTRVIKLRLAHDVDVDKLRDAFEAVVRELDPAELGDPDEAMVRVGGQDVFGVEVWFCLPCADPNTSWDIACQAREKIIARAAEMERESGRPVFPEANPAEAA